MPDILRDHPKPDSPEAQDAGRREVVDQFYERNPFPGYARGEDAAALLSRSRGMPFLQELDRAVPVRARVLDAGCGTGQISCLLALGSSSRRVVAFDRCRASLLEAEEFRRRAGIENLHFLRGDLLLPPTCPGSFDVVISRGVIHHTTDPYRALERLADSVAKGGVLLLGFYESWARAAHRLRRGLFRIAGRPVQSLDPVLRNPDLDPEKKRIWIEDQYRHPLEVCLRVGDVVMVLERSGLCCTHLLPPLVRGEDWFRSEGRLRSRDLFLRRLSWLGQGIGSADAGLVFVLARRA